MRLVVLAVLLAACAPLAPYQRARLMTRPMAAPLDPLEERADAHVEVTREAQRGATRTGGAACGCN